MFQSTAQRALCFFKDLKLEFSDDKMEQDYWTVKKENMIKDFKVCLNFLILFHVWIVIISIILESQVEAYIAGGNTVFLLLLYCFRKYLINYIQFVTFFIILAYDITRLFMLKSAFKQIPKSSVFYGGFTLSSIQGILLFRLLKVSHKSLGLIILLAFRYLFVSLYIEPGTFSWSLFTRNCMIDTFIMYTFYNQESTFRKIYQGFTQKKEELLKFKELIAESLPQSLVVLACESSSLLFSNKTFQSTFKIPNDLEKLKTQLESMAVDLSTVRETATHTCNLTFDKDTKQPLSLAKVLKKFESDNDLNTKTISLAASLMQQNVRRLLEVTVKKVKWDNEDAIAILFNDITYQENLIALKLANINKDKVISTVSHELRTPLNGIIGILDITKKKVDDPEIYEYLSLCKDNANLLLSLVNSILDLQQISAGKLKLNPANIDIHKVANSVAQLFYFQCKEKNIALECDIHEDVPVMISTDENRLKQILINLFGNAIKFTSKGYVKLYIALNKENQDNLHISVSDTGIGIKQEDQKRLFNMYGKIEDGESVNKNGVGLGLTISNALVALLNGGFDSKGISVESEYGIGSKFYFQIQKTLKEKRQMIHPLKSDPFEAKAYTDQITTEFDTSKGLLIQKATTNGGQGLDEECLTFIYGHPNDFNEFSVPSNIPSKLSTYTSVLSSFNLFTHVHQNMQPRATSQNKVLENAISSSPYLQKQASVTEAVEPGLNILIVDDNPFNLLVAKSLIQEFRCNIQTALGGQEAVDIVKKSLSKGTILKAIFMDCQMPIMDGFETTKTIRALMENGEIPGAPIFGWTANNSEEDVKRCYEAGMVGYLPKPASKKDFSGVLSQLGHKLDNMK